MIGLAKKLYETIVHVHDCIELAFVWSRYAELYVYFGSTSTEIRTETPVLPGTSAISNIGKLSPQRNSILKIDRNATIR